MTRVTLVCKTCGYKARRDLMYEPGSRGIHETSCEPATCINGHGALVREDERVVNSRYAFKISDVFDS
jgi:hypothetical protein